ncbi:glycosyltransferase family protein [Pseudomonas sp. MAHUQ-62]|uniref:glycosyltransferase family protein n=1 Tax=Pseudomonas sp. GCM10023245 TaxID=3252652 RepID=UPI003614919F
MKRPTTNVLMVIEGEIATTQLIEQVLVAGARFGISYRKKLLSDLKLEDFGKRTIPLFVRCGDPSLELWVKSMSKAGYPYLYYIDDNFWKIEGDSLIAHYYQHPLVRRSLELAVSNAHCLLTNSDVLAEFLKQFNGRIRTLPAFFDFSLVKNNVRTSNRELRIGFAGSPSRVADLEIIKPLIAPVLADFPEAVFEFAGAMPKDINPSERVRFFPHTSDYAGFIRFKEDRNWAIGLAPLADTESNRCKTNNKYREYSACRIPGIYSNISPYQASVTSGVNGILVDNSTGSWLSAVNTLLTDEVLRNSITANAHADVRQKHSVEQVAESWAKVISEVNTLLQKNGTPRLRQPLFVQCAKQRLLHIESLWVRVSTIYQTDGLTGVVRKLAARVGREFSSLLAKLRSD